MAATDQAIVQQVADLMAALSERVPGLRLVYLFGSTAKGRRHPGSDIDIALLAASPLGQVARFDLAAWLAEQLGAEVDLIDLSQASTVMQKEVVAHAQLVFGDEIARVAYEGRVLSAYARLNEERRPILERIAREGRIL